MQTSFHTAASFFHSSLRWFCIHLSPAVWFIRYSYYIIYIYTHITTVRFCISCQLSLLPSSGQELLLMLHTWVHYITPSLLLRYISDAWHAVDFVIVELTASACNEHATMCFIYLKRTQPVTLMNLVRREQNVLLPFRGEEEEESAWIIHDGDEDKMKCTL